LPVSSITPLICVSLNGAAPNFLRALGIEHRRIFGNGGADAFHFVVRAVTIEFLKPAVMDDELCVETRPSATAGPRSI
jgi:acyl-CoA thioesterase FadM